MGIAYLVCFVALLQISLCMPAEDSTPLDEAGSETVALTETTAVESSEPSSLTPTEELESSSVTEGPTTTSDTEIEVVSYQTIPEANTTSTEAPPMTTTPKPNHAALVFPNALVLIVPVCIRLFSTKLLGLV